ncbi:hypothetical protein CYMTET_29662 [Cymbomonas tetramitiformis]|uniref:Uncharacterized protein n=1 Tax=Cymbomonas tetramitiformis TaxID=36881 RepID=A0AAE0FKL0_9CHLO|nr:hypothetical protein CYMTET_29662 [Cymbomonas tetramitiformis]
MLKSVHVPCVLPGVKQRRAHQHEGLLLVVQRQVGFPNQEVVGVHNIERLNGSGTAEQPSIQAPWQMDCALGPPDSELLFIPLHLGHRHGSCPRVTEESSRCSPCSPPQRARPQSLRRSKEAQDRAQETPRSLEAPMQHGAVSSMRRLFGEMGATDIPIDAQGFVSSPVKRALTSPRQHRYFQAPSLPPQSMQGKPRSPLHMSGSVSARGTNSDGRSLPKAIDTFRGQSTKKSVVWKRLQIERNLVDEGERTRMQEMHAWGQPFVPIGGEPTLKPAAEAVANFVKVSTSPRLIHTVKNHSLQAIPVIKVQAL